MGKIISIYGANGSGKTTIAANLGYMISETKTVGIVTTAMNCTGISKLFGMQVEEEKSIKKIYLNVNDTDYISKFAQCPSSKNLFLLTAPDNMDCLTLADTACHLSGTDAQNFIPDVKTKFDYVIFDCDNDVNNPLSTYSLKYADLVIDIIKPTVQGIEFEKAYRPFFSKLKIMNRIIRIINNDKGYLSIKSIESAINSIDYVLPYEKGIEISENEGEVYMSESGGNQTFFSGIKEPWRKKFKELAGRVIEIE